MCIIVIITLHLSISLKYFQIPKKPKVISTKSTFWMTPKCHVFPIFPELPRSDVGFTDSDSFTA